ncbi:MAG: methionyl-tRNA formyltransferase [Candidatus Saccharimonadales bacterium]
MKPSSKLVFFGTEDFSLPSLQALIEAGYNVVAVVTKPDTQRGRSNKLIQPVVKTYASSNNIPVFQPNRLSDIEHELTELHANAAVLVSYGKLLPQRTLNVFSPLGIINLHPSLLPRYRGPAPIEAAIVNGDSETGISIMRLTAGMDEGPVYTQELYTLHGTEAKPELTKTLALMGAELLVSVLPDILSGKLQPIPQQNTGVSYTTLLSKKNGILDPSTDDANAIERKVRAYLNYPKTRLTLDKNDVIITSVNVVESLADYPLTIECKDKTYLALTQVTAPSGKSMSGEAYLHGYTT